MNHNVLVYLRI